jgi:hypothetical protein
MKRLSVILVFIVSCSFFSFLWGFFAHKQINKLAVFCLPAEMIGFYKANIDYLSDASVNPDRRRLAVVDEAARHYIDLDHFGDSALQQMPRFWNEAVARYTEDTLKQYGIVPWHVNLMFYRLKDAFLVKDAQEILRLSAELGHYVADAHVPLHTTKNYNGQLTNQEGIHGFWESRLPELFFNDYSFFVGKGEYLRSPLLAIWHAVETAHHQVDSVLAIEQSLTQKFGERKYSFETRGKQTIKVYSTEFSKACHDAMDDMVQRQMRAAIKTIASFWYTAWVDAGQPDLKNLLYYKPTEQELMMRREELKKWKEEQKTTARPHETEN